MRLGTRIFLCYVAILIICFSFPIKWTLDNLRIRYLEGVEDSLSDQANILASWVGVQMENGNFRTAELVEVFKDVNNRKLSARIYSMLKTHVDMQIYITDAAGIVIFDSEDASRVGENYNEKWRDVQLTLRGEYGARSTKTDAKDPDSSVLHVAAPIMAAGKIAGVLTVVKPTTTINMLLATAITRLELVFGISTLVAVLLSFLVSLWMTSPIKRLTQYADDMSNGKRTPFPRLDKSEIGEMGKSFERMQEALEGKRYVEGYVQTLTHEIKSPLSAIRGAAELLEEKMAPDQQARFLGNIRNEAGRIQDIVDRLLELSALENLKILEKREKILFSSLIRAALESKDAILSKKGLRVVSQFPSDVMIEGEPFLLRQALSNLLQNAIDFSPAGGKIELKGEVAGNMLNLSVRDYGPGVPDYAKPKLFDKFFSLQRPDTGKKSTGLGLNFVREVALLHKGDISLDNCPDGGLRALLSIPCLEK
ncbi:MAG: two-component system sensor histidine kinase CreC [Desulfobacteraceae bacterium]|nr:MAG: two-component system sensor histidine kinase CreC [Desulfobacteraceae bacterium]